MKFSIVDRGDDNSKAVSAYVINQCEENEWIYEEKDPEIVLSVGGDGTMLRSIHTYMDILDRVCFVGIHTGTLGFFTDYTQAEIHLFVHDLLTKKPKIEEFPLLEISLPEIQESFYAFNEMRIESIGKTLSLNIYIDGEFFEKTTGSGVCLSTQFGSTAVNRALSGAVVDSGLQVLQLCEIMPISHINHHSLRNPYIMRKDRRVVVKGDSIPYAIACFDHLTKSLENIHEIHMSTSTKKVRFARYRTYSYLRRLKNLY